MDERNKVIDLKSAKGDSAERNFNSKFGNYKPDEELLQSTARIKTQRDLIRERIQKMEIAAARVTRGVFEKVKRDYALQLQTINDLLNEKKELLRKEIKELYLRREKLTVEINRHREILEEAEFRHFLGEFSESQFHEVEHYETKEIEKLESDLAHITQFVRAHEELFDPEDLGLPPQPVPAPVIQAAPAKQTAPIQQPVEQPSAAAVEASITIKQQQTQHVTKQPVQADVVKPQQNVVSEASVSPKQEVSVSQKIDSSSASIDTTDFEDLFLDDEDSVNMLEQEQSQSNIKKLLKDDSQADKDLSIASPDEAESGDYFSQENVSESSLTVKKKQTSEIGEFEKTPPPSKLDEIEASSPKVEAKKNITEDSISDILNSINIDSASPATPEKQMDATNIPLSTDSPVSQSTGYVLTLIEGDLDTKEFPLKENTSIGRSPTNDVVLKAPKVSRQHAAINMYNNQYIIIDLKSSNGVYVNGSKVDEAVLNSGDEVSVGGYRFTFHQK